MTRVPTMPRPWVVRSLGKALALLAALLLGIAALVAAGYLQAGQPIGWTLLRVVVGAVAYTGAGAAAWWRRPSNRMGQIMLLGAAVWLVSALGPVHGPVLATVGVATRILPFAVIVHLLLAFPSGRLRSPLARWTVAGAYVICLALQVPTYLPALPAGATTPRTDAISIRMTPMVVAGSVMMLVTAFLLIDRLRCSSARQRLVLGPLYLYGTVAVLAVPALPELVQPLTGASALAINSIQVALLIGVPVAFASAMLLGGFARAGNIQELGAWLGGTAAAPDSLPQALAAALGDRSVQLAYRMPEHAGYADSAGRPVTLPRPGSGRAFVHVQVADRPVGVIVYDATLIADSDLVRAASRVIALAMDHQRLTAELAASHRQVQLSRERIVQAGDRERRRIAQDLHDGVQAQLVLLAVEAQQLADGTRRGMTAAQDAARLRVHIDQTAAGLRDLVYQVMPAPLIERGLAAAAEDLIDRMPMAARMRVEITDEPPYAMQSTAYFVIAEALGNAVKHSHARRLTVEIVQRELTLTIRVDDDGVGGARASSGFGLTGLNDRVEVVGGVLRIDSPPGGGTHVTATLPYPEGSFSRSDIG